jgi:hypothetical protein
MKKQIGRPPLSPGEAKGAVLQIRLTEAQRAEYAQAAERAGMSLSAWIRDRLAKASKREAR